MERHPGNETFDGFERLPTAEYLPRHTVAERMAKGRSARRDCPLGGNGRWAPTARRADPVAILEEQATARIPSLVPLRYGRMLLSPFAFYRGGAAIMAADLAGTPDAGFRAQLCGDAHLLNFGLFETPERSLIFGLNDFDETLPGPFEWDVKRLAASVEIAGRDLGLSTAQRERALGATVRSYREAMLEFAAMRNTEVWYARLPAKQLQRQLTKEGGVAAGTHVHKQIRKALTRNHLSAFDRLLAEQDGELRFLSNPPVLVPAEELLDHHERARYVEVVSAFLRQYRESVPPDRRRLVESYRFVQLARKVVGVGSVGTRAWVVLFLGRDDDDPLLLQLKEARPSVLEPYAGPSEYSSNGRRVVEGQRLMQAASDPMLGWYRLRAFDDQVHDFYVRQLWDGKASIEVAHLGPDGLVAYGEVCGWTLARGHARSGDRIAIAAYLGESDEFDRAIGQFAVTYADVTESDHGRLHDAADTGRVPVLRDV